MLDNVRDNMAASAVGGRFMHETNRLKRGFTEQPHYGPTPDDLYKAAFSYIRDHLDATQQEFLPADLLIDNLRMMFWKSAILKREFPDGPNRIHEKGPRHYPDEFFIHTIAPLPTTDMNKMLSDKEISDHEYLYHLISNRQNGFTSNFSINEGKYFGLLPEFIQNNCSFIVKYESSGAFITLNDLKNIFSAYIKAFNNLRKYFELPPIVLEQIVHVFREEGIELGNDFSIEPT